MARYRNKIGFYIVSEKPANSGVWVEDVVERYYTGDIVQNISRWQSAPQENDNLNVMNRISIVADAYAYQNFQHIKYATYMGARWKVNSIQVERPRLILNLGGVYNGESPRTPGQA